MYVQPRKSNYNLFNSNWEHISKTKPETPKPKERNSFIKIQHQLCDSLKPD